MPSDEVTRLLEDIETGRVAPVHYSRKSLSSRVALLMILVLKAVLGRR